MPTTRVSPVGHEDARRTGITDPFVLFFGISQIVIIALFGFATKYAPTADPRNATSNLIDIYGMFSDVHVMVFIGFGFLMTFLKRFSWTAVGMTFLVGVFAFEVAILSVGFWHRVFGDAWDRIPLDLTQMVAGDFGAATVLISVGAMLGRATPAQMLVMAIFEMVAYGLNEAILIKELKIGDVGGSLVIHAFGAYFGLACSWVLGPRKMSKDEQRNNGSVYHSDVFAMIGTLFLWIYWPSFNSALAGDDGNTRHRTVINTVLALVSSTMFAFVTSRMLRKGRFNMVDVQNATLAGAVAIGGSANLLTMPWGAMTVGGLAGCMSVFGYAKIQGWLASRFGLHDTCGIHYLHGMPGLLGGFASAFFASISSADDYSTATLEIVLPGRATRSAGQHAGYQLLAIAVTFGMAIVSGVIAGIVIRFMRAQNNFFSDADHWDMEGDEDDDNEDDRNDV